MINERIASPTILKLYGLNVPNKYGSEKKSNISTLTLTEKGTKKKIGRNFNNYKNLIKNGSSQDSSGRNGRNKSSLMTNYKGFYSLAYYNNQIKSIKNIMGIQNTKYNKINNQLNAVNINKIHFPINHIKITFDILGKNNYNKELGMFNTKPYLKISKQKKIIYNINSKNKINEINSKDSQKIGNLFSNEDFSQIEIDKNKINKIKESINLPSVSLLKKKKIDINIDYFDKLFSFIPDKPIIKIHKEKTFSKSLDNKISGQILLKPKNIYNNLMNLRSDIDIKKLNNTNNNFKQILKDTTTKQRNVFSKKKINSNNIYDLPPMNYYKDNYYYYNIYPSNCGWLIKDCFANRLKWKKCHCNNTNLFNFKWKEVIWSNDEFLELSSKKTQMINHFENHSCLSNKCNMFCNFANYCEENNIDIFRYLPFTIIVDISQSSIYSYRNNFKQIFDNIQKFIFDSKSINNNIFDRRKIPYKSLFPMNDPKFGLKIYCEISKSHYDGKNLWIVKAPNLNRGRGVKIFNNYKEILSYIKKIAEGKITESELYNIKNKDTNITNKKERNSAQNTNEKNNLLKDEQDYIYQSSKIIIQKYIEKPFLYNGRKCDIRIWVLITHKMKVYIFKEGHLKASSVSYNKDDFDSFIHITNYSLQKYNKFFSKYEKGNEISFQKFQNFIDENNKFDFRKEIYPKFVEIVKYTALSVRNKININNINHCFEIFGYDFMMDDDKNVFLIEINTNPGLEISSDIIAELVPRMIDNALLLTVDELFPTEYSKESLNEKGQYKSKFHVNGYNDDENMWEFVCDMKKYNEKEMMNSDNFHLKKKKIKIKKMKN